MPIPPPFSWFTTRELVWKAYEAQPQEGTSKARCAALAQEFGLSVGYVRRIVNEERRFDEYIQRAEELRMRSP